MTPDTLFYTPELRCTLSIWRKRRIQRWIEVGDRLAYRRSLIEIEMPWSATNIILTLHGSRCRNSVIIVDFFALVTYLIG